MNRSPTRRRGRRRYGFNAEDSPPGGVAEPTTLAGVIGFLVAAQGMVVMFGGTRFWASAPFLGLWWIFCAGVCAYSVLKAGDLPGRIRIPVEGWGLLALAVYALGRAMWDSAVPYESISEAYLLAGAFVVFVTASRLGASKNGWTVFAVGVAAAGLFHAMFAMRLHWLGERSVLWLERPEHYGMRASGTFICPNHFGHYLQMAIVVCFALLLTPKLRIGVKLFAGYAFVMMIPALVLTLSRSALLGVAAGLGVVTALVALRRSFKTFLGVLAAGFLAVLGLAAVLFFGYAPFRDRMHGSDVTSNIRATMIWPDTWSMIQGEGFWGSGPGTYPHVFDTYREKFNFSSLYLEYAHNEYLHLLAEYGWVPTLLILSGVVWVGFRGLRASLRESSGQKAMIPVTGLGVLAATLVHAVFDFNLHITANAYLLVAVLGCLYGAGAIRGVWKTPPLSARMSRGVLGAVAMSALALLLPTVPLGMGSFHAYQARLARERHDADEAARHAALQRKWLPARSDGWTQLGLDKRKSAFWTREPERRVPLIAESRAAYGEALRRNPYDRIALAGRIELLKMESRWEEALTEIEHLQSLAPFDVRVRIQKGIVLRRMGRHRDALRVFEEARRMRRGPDRQININIRMLRRRLRDRESQADPDVSKDVP